MMYYGGKEKEKANLVSVWRRISKELDFADQGGDMCIKSYLRNFTDVSVFRVYNLDESFSMNSSFRA